MLEQVQVQARQDPPYILGHSKGELDRLIHQSRFFGDLTEQMLRLAGIDTGMRVLDIGCGVGDISFLTARLVGPQGAVIGIDKSPEAVSVATQRAKAAGLTNVQFMVQDLVHLGLDEPVDALIGRLIVMYFADPAAMLRRLLHFVKPDGIVAFQEIEPQGAVSEPRCELYETTIQRISQTFTRAGTDLKTSLKLSHIFQDAGLPSPQMMQLARVERGPDSLSYAYLEQLARSILPLMQSTGVATADEVDIDTLATRIRAEALANNAVLVIPPLIGAWTRKALD